MMYWRINMNRTTLLLGTAALLFGTTACLQSEPEAPPEKVPPVVESAPLPQGEYGVQSISFDDASGLYTMFLLDTPPGTPAQYQTQDLRLAQLTDEETTAGKRAHVVVDADGPVAKIPADYQIAYTHNVVEDRGGQPVVVQQHSSMWSPFMMGMTGAMVGQMLFAPRYYYPPPYAGGGVMGGFGGAGATRVQATSDYTSKHGAAPQSTRLSKSGYAKAPAAGLKSTGSGAGSSKLRPTTTPRPRPSGRGFGGGRRR
jgi:hypothetical protein